MKKISNFESMELSKYGVIKVLGGALAAQGAVTKYTYSNVMVSPNMKPSDTRVWTSDSRTSGWDTNEEPI